MTMPDGAPMGAPTQYCERCGAGREIGAGNRLSSELRQCPECELHVCSDCQDPAGPMCVDCAAAARARADRRRAAAPVAAAVAMPSEPSGRVAGSALGMTSPRPTTRPARRRVRWAAVAPGVLVVAGALLLAINFWPRGTPDRSGAVAPAVGVPSAGLPTGSAAGPRSASPSFPSSPSSPSVGAGQTPGPVAGSEPRVVVETAVARAAATGVTTRAAVLAVLRNDGSSAVELPPSSTRYEVDATSGSPVAGGVFTWVVPARLEPGERAYAVEVMPALFRAPDTLGDVTVEPVARPAEGPSPAPLEVGDVEWTVADDGAVSARGRITNASATEVREGMVAVVLLDERDRPLAVVYDVVDVVGVLPGETRVFSTDYPRSVGVREADVARVETFAYDLAALTGP
jgi:hypothetical protein